MYPTSRSYFPSAAKVALPLILILPNIGLGLWKIHSAFFVSVPVWQYLANAWAAITAAGAVVGGIGLAIRIGRTLVTGRESGPRDPTDRVILRVSKAVTRSLRRPPVSLGLSIVLVATATAIYFIPIRPSLTRTSSSVVATMVGFNKYIYVADGAHGQVLVFDSSNLRKAAQVIPVGTAGNLESNGSPESMLELRRDDPRGPLHLIFVTDPAAHKVHVIDLRTNTLIPPGLSVDKVPRSLAITPDGRKLFVSNEQPVPNGGITVFDISDSDPGKFHSVARILGVNCPEGIALSPWGDLLYVASQCGGDGDPVFIIDTASNNKVASIPNMAVGTSVASNKDGSRLYVGRGNFPCVNPNSKERGSPLTVVDVKTKRPINTLCLRTSVGSLAVSRDPEARYLFVVNGNYLSIFDTKTIDSDQQPLKDIQLEGPIQGLGIADDNSVYAFIPSTPRIFVTSPTGLAPE
jgi:DNA-binding beta-propeller fold protein YncE